MREDGLNVLRQMKGAFFPSQGHETEEGRRAERYRRVALSVGANAISKSAALAVMVLGVTLTLPYLGAERFGVWMTIASFSALLAFLDFGVGNALTNEVARRVAAGDSARTCEAITGGLGLLLIAGLITSLLLMLIALVLPWQALIKVAQPALFYEVRVAGMVFAALFGLCLLASGVHRVFAGLQLSYLGHLASAAGSLLSIPLLWWAAAEQASIPWLVALTLGVQIAVGLFLVGNLATRRLVRWSAFRTSIRNTGLPLLRPGSFFLLLQIGGVIGWGADNLIISSSLGAAEVAIYAIAQRLFQFVSQPLAMLNAPLWSAYADANARRDTHFLRSTLPMSLGASLVLGATLASALVWLGPTLIARWTSGQIEVAMPLLLMFAIWAVLEAIGGAFAMFLNGCTIVRPQVVTVGLLMSISLPAKVWAVNHFGLQGMLSIYIALYAGVQVLMYGFVYRSQIRSALN
jgi:O-antigen/teichoic acid export membrane protein